MQEQIDQMSQEIGDLRGQLERNSYEMQQMLQRQRELFVELDRIRGEMKSAPVKKPNQQKLVVNTRQMLMSKRHTKMRLT